MAAGWTYGDAVSRTEKVLIRGKLYKADVFITSFAGLRYVVKDYSRKGFWERNLVGRLVIGREARAYAALAGIEGLPARFARLSPFTLAVEFLEGRDFGAVERGELGPDSIRQFEQTVHGLHRRGWVHLDLHRRSNILLVNGKVILVDLASALNPGSIPLIGGCLTFLIGIPDQLALIKLKTLFCPELMTSREQKWLRLRNRVMPTKWK